MQQKPDGPDNMLSALGGQAGAVRPLAWLHRAHAEQIALCNALEEIADSLPGSIDQKKCLSAARALGPLIKGMHHYEENTLFPWLERRAAQTHALGDVLAKTLARLKQEHFEDECFAEELTDTLLKLGSGHPVNMEATGYMLRGFFEAVRRHIAFERTHLLQEIPEDTLIGPGH